MKKRITSIAIWMAISAVTATAAPISIVFSNGSLTGGPGTTITFVATMTNTTASTQNLNGDSFTVQSPFAFPANFNDSAFLNLWPLSLSAGGSYGPAGLFDVTIPLNTPAGSYTQAFNLLGGTGPSDQNLIGTATFQINVVPEPGTGVMTALAGGLLVLLMVWKSRGRQPRLASVLRLTK
jgi:hypothetical protein